LKSSGFNIEDTHLSDRERVEKLFSIVIIAYTWSFIVGIYIHKNIKEIRTLKHGKKPIVMLNMGLITLHLYY